LCKLGTSVKGPMLAVCSDPSGSDYADPSSDLDGWLIVAVFVAVVDGIALWLGR